jgi:hypothetical protein
MLRVGRTGALVILDGAVWVANHESPVLAVVAQRAAVLQILFKDMRLILYGDLGKFP